MVIQSSQSLEKRRGVLELQIAVTGGVASKLIHSVSVTSQAEDARSTRENGLLGFTAVGVRYERRPDSELVSEGVGKAALELWCRLVGSSEAQVSNTK